MKTKFGVFLLTLFGIGGSAFGQNNARMLSTPNAQTGTSYTFVAADTTRVVTFNNAGAVAATLPNGATFGFGAGTMLSVANLGAGSVTITCSSCTINGAAALSLSQNQGADIYGGSGTPAVNYIALFSPSGSFVTLSANNSFTGLNIDSQVHAFNGGIASSGPTTLTGNVTAIAGQNILCVYNLVSTLYVDGAAAGCTGGKYTTLAAAIAACPIPSTTKGCVIYDFSPETFAANPFTVPETFSLELHLGPGLWRSNATITLSDSHRIIGSGRAAFTLPCTASSTGTCIMAGASFPASTPLIKIGSGVTTGNVFDTNLQQLTLDCNNVAGSIGIFTDVANEKSGAQGVTVENCADTQIRMTSVAGGAVDSNSIWRDMELFSPTNSPSSLLLDIVAGAGSPVTGAVFDGMTASFIGTQGTKSVRVVGQSLDFKRLHMENTLLGLSIEGVSTDITVENPTANSNVVTMVNIGGSGAGINIVGWHALGATNAIIDTLCSSGTQTITDGFGGYHFLSGQGSCQNNSSNFPTQSPTLLPTSNGVKDIGSTALGWRDLYLLAAGGQYFKFHPSNTSPATVGINIQHPGVGISTVGLGMTGNTGTGLIESVRGTAGCTTSGGATPFTGACTTGVTLPTGFADTNFTAICFGRGAFTGVPVLQGVTATSTNSITVQTQQATGVNASFATIDCFAMHD